MGCISSNTTLTTARTLAPGDVRLAGGAAVPVSTRFVSEVANALIAATDRLSDADTIGAPVMESERRDAQTAALAALLLMPAPVFELSGRVGVVDDLDVGVRWAGTTLGADAKLRLREGGDGSLHVALIGGYVYHSDLGASVVTELEPLFDDLELLDYSRHDLRASVLLSNDSERIFSWYASLSYVVSFASFESRLVDSLAIDEAFRQTDTSAVIHQFGPTFGIRLGTENVGLLVELSVHYMHFKPRVLGAETNLSGLIITPALGGALSF